MPTDICLLFSRDNFLKVVIYYGDLNYEYMEQIPSYDLMVLLGECLLILINSTRGVTHRQCGPNPHLEFTTVVVIERHSTYGLRSCHNLLLPRARTTCYGLETISFLRRILWQALPNDMKQSDTLSNFKRE